MYLMCFCDWQLYRPMHEITFSTDDKPKVLSQVGSVFAYVNIVIKSLFDSVEIKSKAHIDPRCFYKYWSP